MDSTHRDSELRPPRRDRPAKKVSIHYAQMHTRMPQLPQHMLQANTRNRHYTHAHSTKSHSLAVPRKPPNQVADIQWAPKKNFCCVLVQRMFIF